MAKQRYAAKLIFQFRIDLLDDSGKYRIFETRLLNDFIPREVLRETGVPESVLVSALFS